MDSLNFDSNNKKGDSEIFYCLMHSDTNNNGTYEEGVSRDFEFRLLPNKLYFTKDNFIKNFITFDTVLVPKTDIVTNSDWIKIADMDANSWIVIDQDLDFDFPEYKVTVIGSIKVDVSKVESTKELIINNINYSAHGFNINYHLEGVGERENYSSEFNVIIDRSTVIWYIDGVGIAEIDNSSWKTTTNHTSVKFPMIEAENSKLVRFFNQNVVQE